MSTQHNVANTKGSGHWRLQRLSALALIPLTLWFMFSIINHIGDDYQTAVAWASQPGIAVLLALYVGFMFFHGQLGMQEIIEDYVHGQKVKAVCLVLLKVVLWGAAAVGLYSIFRIAF